MRCCYCPYFWQCPYRYGFNSPCQHMSHFFRQEEDEMPEDDMGEENGEDTGNGKTFQKVASSSAQNTIRRCRSRRVRLVLNNGNSVTLRNARPSEYDVYGIDVSTGRGRTISYDRIDDIECLR